MTSDKRGIDFGFHLSRRVFIQKAAAAAGVVTMGGMLSSRAFADQSLVWYSGSSVESVDDWAKDYKAKSGTNVEYFRAGGVKLAQKFEQEAKAGQVKCDTIDISLPGLMTQWAEKGLLLKYESPEASHYPADLRMAGFWTPIKALDICIAYNADIIKPADAPKTWADLLDPKWKGKMVMADPALSGGVLQWYAALRKLLGKDYVEKLGKQDILIRSGSGEVLDTIITGERPLAASALQYYASAKAKPGRECPDGLPGRRCAGRSGNHRHLGERSQSGRRQEVHRLHPRQGSAGDVAEEILRPVSP